MGKNRGRARMKVAYGSMASNASVAWCAGQTKAPASLIKKD